MAKKKSAIDAIKAKTGVKTLREAGQVAYWVDTGNLALNWSLSGKFIGGGYPGGRIIESMGPESFWKELLGYCFLGSIQRMGGISVQLDCERASNDEFAHNCGHVDVDDLLVDEPIPLEDCQKSIIRLVNAIREEIGPEPPIGIMWDSIGVNPTRREWLEIDLPDNPTKEDMKRIGGNEAPGERAKVANGVLRKLNPFLHNNGATLYVVNQLRDKIGVLYGDPRTGAGGGQALKYYASVRMMCGSPKEFVDKNTKTPLGVNMKVRNKKNRHHIPGQVVEEIPLFFKFGINPLGGLIDTLLKAERISGSRGNYTVCEPWANGETVKFKCAKDSAPEQVLHDYPGLIDAKDKDEIESYLKEWQQAILATNEAEEVHADKIDHLTPEAKQD